MNYVDCSSRCTVLKWVSKLVPVKKLDELFPRDEKSVVGDGVYAEIKSLLQSGSSFSDNRLIDDADLFCVFLCYRCVRGEALIHSLLVLTVDRELNNALDCVALLCESYSREGWTLTPVECKLLLLGLLKQNAQREAMPVIKLVMNVCEMETVSAVPRLTCSSWMHSTVCTTASYSTTTSCPPPMGRSSSRSSWVA